jgi:hypothetical protein
MPNIEYEREKAERDKKDKQRSIIMFPIIFIIIFSGLAYIVLNR